MDRFLNAVKGHAAAMDRAQGQPRFGLVASIDSTRYAVRVRLQPEDVLSGWLPVVSPWVGAGWGFVALPSAGDQVLVLAHEGDADNGIVVGACFSTDAVPPGNAPGEVWLVHRSGTSICLSNDGTVRIRGDLHVSGDVYDGAGSLARLRGHYDQHVHAGPGAPTSAPD